MASESKKLSLGIRDRLTIPSLFPERSNFIDKTYAEDIGAKIRVSQDEIAALNLKYTEPDSEGKQMLTWSRDADKDIEVEFTEAEIAFLLKQLDKLDKAEDLTNELYPLMKELKAL